MEAGGGLRESIRRDAGRSLFRAKNGIRYLTGIGAPAVGVTPSEVIWTREKAKLVRYHNDTRSRKPPLVIVPSIISRAYILDLRPGQSFIGRMLEAGIDVFLVDWGEAEAVDSTNTLETYADNYLPRAINAVLESSRSDEVDLLGYCFGGTLSLLCLAGHPEIPARNLAAIATPIDFTKLEGLVQAIRRRRLEVDDLLDHTGNIPAETVYRGFSSLRPTTDIFKYANLWERLWNDEFMDSYQSLGQWLRDQVPFPGACARQSVELLLRQNLLTTGEIPLGGRRVRLGDISTPVLNVMAEHDHMVPPPASEPLSKLVGSSDTQELRVQGGHVGLIVGRDAGRTTIPGIIDWLEARSV
jgi:polyhydroxyalkanoate synthase